jgi:2-(1,2-epoxy-1,2-dihydrophenyl)acetyl-CoA isomerase
MSLIQRNLQDRVLWLSFNRPDKRNAISAALREELSEALRQAAGDEGVEVVVLTGSAGVFCAGADVAEIRQCANPAAVQDIIRANVTMRDQWASFPKPTIAAVDGVGYGLGFILPLKADYVVVTEGARFCLPEARLGLPVTQVESYVARFGAQRANDLLIACRVLTGREAQAWGIANYVVADEAALRETTRRLADDIQKAATRKLRW